MSRLLTRSVLRVFSILFLHLIVANQQPVVAQSKQAYMNAARACLVKQDAFGAKSFLQQALLYGEDPVVLSALAEAEFRLFNYKQSLEFAYQAIALGEKKKKSELSTAEMAQLLRLVVETSKRSGIFEQADTAINQLAALIPDSSMQNMQLRIFLRETQAAVQDTFPVGLYPVGGDVNTAQSDFAPCFIGDSLLLYSSLRYLTGTDENKKQTSRLAITPYPPAQALRRSPSTLIENTINQPSFNTANASVSPDGKWMVFSRCLEDAYGILKCALYISSKSGNNWGEAIRLDNRINSPDYTSTQPCLSTDGAEGYVLFYSSNRPGGLGGTDLYKARMNQGRFSAPESLGNSINTEHDEWTPFYDAFTDTLYFSSERPGGVGGLDLYSIQLSKATEKANLLPIPYNSSYNDLYMTRSYGPKRHTLLVSNRPPAQSLDGSACCYDLFSIEADTSVNKALREITLSSNDYADSISGSGLTVSLLSDGDFKALTGNQQLNYLNQTFPIRLYFDNDYPDPRSRKSTTRSQVDTLCRNYLLRKDAYIREQSSHEQSTAIDMFFRDSVKGHMDKLDSFTRQLILRLQGSENRLTITVKGTASPLAETRYNLTLSERRINSLLNFWRSWEGGILEPFLTNGRLNITFIPSGEDATSTVSDRLNEQARSVYSLGAALERRIEIIRIEELK
ncbi:MAG: hypothetical protein LW707_04935 [Sphingobacteriales bacterium]|nr:hypothetical protein [Sphingobacteriales bacterium]